jgi:hypothetical protein
MANNDDYLRLRRMTGEVDISKYSNTDLEIYIQQASGSLESAAATIWSEKASAYADLVNVSEAGSSRSYSDLYERAIAQRDHYAALAGQSVVDVSASSTTRRIVRA